MNKVEVNDSHRGALRPLHELLWKWNQAHNLFSRRLKAEDLDALLLECLAFSPFLPSGCRVADVGSGAGLPGLPLAMIRRDLKLTLVEPRAKRCTWLRYATQQLELPVDIIEGRWDPQRTDFDHIISRAVFPPVDFLEAVGILAPLSLQMTGPTPKGVGSRSCHHVWLNGQLKGSILAGKECVFSGA